MFVIISPFLRVMHMNFKLFVFCFTTFLLTSCSMKDNVPLMESYKDGFLFTSARSVDKSEVRCFRLIKNYYYKGAMKDITFPAGLYEGKARNKTGTFYNAPNALVTNAFLF